MNRVILNSKISTYTFDSCISYSEICANGCKWIVCSLYCKLSRCIKEGGLAYIGFAYQTNKHNTYVGLKPALISFKPQCSSYMILTNIASLYNLQVIKRYI